MSVYRSKKEPNLKVTYQAAVGDAIFYITLDRKDLSLVKFDFEHPGHGDDTLESSFDLNDIIELKAMVDIVYQEMTEGKNII